MVSLSAGLAWYYIQHPQKHVKAYKRTVFLGGSSYPRNLVRSLLSLSLSAEENSIVRKLYLGLCIALSLLGIALSGPLEYNDNNEPENFTMQSCNPLEYNDEPEKFTIQSHNPLEYNDKPEKFTIQSRNPLAMEYNDEPERFAIQSSKSIVNNYALNRSVIELRLIQHHSTAFVCNHAWRWQSFLAIGQLVNWCTG